MSALRNGKKCSHTKCMLRFLPVASLDLNTDLFLKIRSNDKIGS